MSKEIFHFTYLSQNYGVSREEVVEWIDVEIIHPYDSSDLLFDKEDLRRIGLICELREHCNPNIESLQVILHLIDQLNHLHNKN